MHRRCTATLVLALTVFAVSVRGGDDPTPGKPGPGRGKGRGGNVVEVMFKKMDANGDGKVTLEEFKKAAEARPQGKLKDNPEMAAKIFDRMDANGDGYVTLEEFKKFREKMAERMKDGKGGKKPPEKKDP